MAITNFKIKQTRTLQEELDKRVIDVTELTKLYGRKNKQWVEVATYALPIASSTTLGGIKIGSGITVAADGTISVTSGGVGTVTSVGLSLPNIFSVTGSPVTGAGTLAASLVSQTAKYVLAAPSGSNGTPTFRALVGTDIPIGAGLSVQGNLITGYLGWYLKAGAGDTYGTLISDDTAVSFTAGSNITISRTNSNVTISATGGGTGTVTSISVTGANGIAVTGSPITTTGTIALTHSNYGNPGTYRSVTINDQGHVIAGTNPTTLAGYGITDAYTVTQLQTSGSSSVHWNNISNKPSVYYTLPVATTTVLGGVKQGANITIAADGTISSTASGVGTVTSVGLSLPNIFTISGSPVTSSGTLTAALQSQTAKTFFAAPNATAGVPSFRTIVGSDLPIATASVIGAVKQGTNITIAADGTISAVAGGVGTVTSIAVSSSDITVSGSPITSSGTINLTLPSIATAGTYRSVTINAKGQVTAGSNPTTLSGYGITDAYSITQLQTSGSSSVHWNNISNKPSFKPTLNGTALTNLNTAVDSQYLGYIVNTSASIAFGSTLLSAAAFTVGQELTFIINNTGASTVTITIPAGANYLTENGVRTVNIAASRAVEISVLRYTSTTWRFVISGEFY